MQLEATVGQPGVTRKLANHLVGGQLSHAYLFFGPSGVGKLRVARAFASDILADSHPDSAGLIASGQHPDYLLVKREIAVIRIEDIRNMEKWLYQKPYWGNRRVVIINEAQYLNRESGNALLKTLEEPPPYAVIILVADSNTLLPTIVSRCQLVAFGPLSTDYIKRVLLDNQVDESSAALAAELAEGSLATAALLVSHGPETLLAETREVLAEMQRGKGHAVVIKAEAMEKDADYRRAFLAALRYVLRSAVQGQELGLKMAPETAYQLLKKMDEQRRWEKVNASPLYLTLDLLWEYFNVVNLA